MFHTSNLSSNAIYVLNMIRRLNMIYKYIYKLNMIYKYFLTECETQIL